MELFATQNHRGNWELSNMESRESQKITGEPTTAPLSQVPANQPPQKGEVVAVNGEADNFIITSDWPLTGAFPL